MGNLKRADTKLSINAVQTNDTFYAKFKKTGSDDLSGMDFFQVSCHGILIS